MIRRPKRGLSLLEIMLATGLFGIVIVGLMVVLGGGLNLLSQAAALARARQIAATELEEVRAGAYAYKPDGTYFDGRQGTPAAGGYPPAPYPGTDFIVAVGVQQITTHLHSVRVEVYWDGIHSYHVETLMNT